MQNRPLFLLILCCILLLGSCKDQAKDNNIKDQEQMEEPLLQKAPKKELTAEDVEQINSVMSRLMVTPELQKYTRSLVSAGLADMLSKQKGPFTVLAPSDAAFDSLTAEKRNFLLNPDNKQQLTNLLKSHIIEGNVASATMSKDIKKNNGSLKLKNLAGGSVTASKEGLNIIISDGKGRKAVMQKSDINGSNGVIHVLDAVLNVD